MIDEHHHHNNKHHHHHQTEIPKWVAIGELWKRNVRIRKIENSFDRLLSRVGTGLAGPDKTGRKVHPAERNRIFAGFCSIFFARFFVRFLPDFCQCDVKNEPHGIYQIFFAGFFAGFLPD
jgi:hypothetical protein